MAGLLIAFEDVLSSCRKRISCSMYENESYQLVQDQEEHQRLDLQHHIYTLSIGGLYLAADLVRRALQPRRNFRPKILDVGAGSGRWYVCKWHQQKGYLTEISGSSIWPQSFPTATP